MSSFILGHKGQVGSIIKSRFPTSNQFNDRIENKCKVDEFFENYNLQTGDYVYLTAAMTNVDLCEEDSNQSFLSNVKGVKNVVDAVLKANAVLIFISSDYVFDGVIGNYTVSDAPNPLNNYGIHKLCAENYIMSKLPKFNYKIIRTNMVYGRDPSGKNFAVRLLNSVSANKEFQVPIDEWVTPTYNVDLVENIALAPFGLSHLAGDTCTNRYSFACTLVEIAGLNTNLVKPIKASFLARKANRPLNGGLVSSVFCGNLYDGIQKMVDEYNNS